MHRWILAAVAAFLPHMAVLAAPLAGEQAALHVLNRVAYGPRPGDLERVQQIGVDRYIDEQLEPPPLPAVLARRLGSLASQEWSSAEALSHFEDARMAAREAKRNAGKDGKDASKDMAPRDAIVQLTLETAEARLLRAVESPRQLEEVMVDFWFNHFNVFNGKGQDKVLVPAYERDAIRPYVFGPFRALLGATAKHPAMLFYLDNWLSKAGALNENYARELMELHTLGVDGGYTQKDVTELARMLTGWTYAPKRGAQFVFDPRRHDNGSKQWLGMQVAGRGQSEGDMALDILAVHPSTARHVSYKLAQYFVSDAPPPALVDRMAQTWTATRGDVRSVLRVLLHSPEFMAQEAYGAKFKTPYQFVVSALRASAAPVDNPRQLAGTLAGMGMPLYGCPTPDGYKNVEAAWLNPDALGRRIAFAAMLGKETEPAPLRAALGAQVSPRTAALAADSPEKIRAAMLLGGPDFMQH